MASEIVDVTRFVEALPLINRLLSLIKDWIFHRRLTINELRDIASELNNVKENIIITKIAGFSLSLVGGSIVLASLFPFAAVPDAVSLVLWGTFTSLVGGITAEGGNIIGRCVSENKVKAAQKMIDQEKEAFERSEKIRKKFEMKANEIETMEDLRREFLLCAGLMAPQYGFELVYDSSRDTHSFGGSARHLSTAIKLEIVATTSVKGAVIFAKNIILRNIQGMLSGSLMIWDIAELVHMAMDINKGSTSGAASDLFKLAYEYEVQMNKVLASLTELEKLAADFQIEGILRKISIKGNATDVEKRIVIEYLIQHASDSWKNEFTRLVANNYQSEYVFLLSRVFHCLKNEMVKHAKELDEDHIEITVIGHGGIRLPMVSSGFHYLNHTIYSITFYEPWGCAIDASVVYGIMTDTLLYKNVKYTGNLYTVTQTGLHPARINWWNFLINCRSSCDDTIPTVELTPVELAPVENKDLTLAKLRHVMERFSRGRIGFAIPYLTEYYDILPLPAIPLYVLCQAVALICDSIGITCKVHIACCLAVEDSNIIRDQGNIKIVNFDQYCTVLAQVPPVMMTNLAVPEELSTRVAMLNMLL